MTTRIYPSGLARILTAGAATMYLSILSTPEDIAFSTAHDNLSDTGVSSVGTGVSVLSARRISIATDLGTGVVKLSCTNAVFQGALSINTILLYDQQTQDLIAYHSIERELMAGQSFTLVLNSDFARVGYGTIVEQGISEGGGSGSLPGTLPVPEVLTGATFIAWGDDNAQAPNQQFGSQALVQSEIPIDGTPQLLPSDGAIYNASVEYENTDTALTNSSSAAYATIDFEDTAPAQFQNTQVVI